MAGPPRRTAEPADDTGELGHQPLHLAISQLGAELKDGKPNLAVRLGGIYALARITKDSPRDHRTSMEVLTAYVRENAPWLPRPLPQSAAEQGAAAAPAKATRTPQRRRPLPQAEQAAADAPKPSESPTQPPRTDVQAVLTVLGRREPSQQFPERRGLDLTRTDLRGADFFGAHLEGATFYGHEPPRQEGLYFGDTQLEGALHLTPEQVISILDYGREVVGFPREWTAEQRAEVQRRWEEEGFR